MEPKSPIEELLPEDEFRDRLHERFYALVGLCLTRWAEIEHSLSEIAHVALGTTPRKAAIVYYRTSGFDNRRKLISELVEAALPEFFGEWKDIDKALADLSKFRNLLAHHTAMIESTFVLTTEITLNIDGVEEKRHLPKVTYTDWKIQVDKREEERGKRKSETAKSQDIRAHLAALEPWESKIKTLRERAATPPAPLE